MVDSQQYETKPETIQAWQFAWEAEAPKWVTYAIDKLFILCPEPQSQTLIVRTGGSIRRARRQTLFPGDWIIRYPSGELEICRKLAFFEHFKPKQSDD